MQKPLIGLACDFYITDQRPCHSVNEKYATSVIDAMNGIPVLIPALTQRGEQSDGLDRQTLDTKELLLRLDGIMFPGSYSNVGAQHYGDMSRPGTSHDLRRDSLTLALIPQAIKLGVPLLAMCRGLQEMNVVYGGSLHQHVHELEGNLDHRENATDTISVRYGHAHTVNLVAGGILANAYNSTTASVNSLHGQGVDRLGYGLQVEATAPDGLIEAFTDPKAPAFNIAVQWHPEYEVTKDPFYSAIYTEFNKACRQRLEQCLSERGSYD